MIKKSLYAAIRKRGVLHYAKHIITKLGTYSSSLLSLNAAHLVIDTFI
jgi:hypothetical protein